MDAIVAAALMALLVLGPFGWLTWEDRRRARADMIAADIRWAVNRRLKGESLLSVEVAPGHPWRSGRVVLSAPSGYGYLVETVWPVVADRVPADYDVVVRVGSRGAPRPAPEERELPGPPASMKAA